MLSFRDPLAGTVDWLIIGFWLTLFFIPNIVATRPRQNTFPVIAVLNFYLGWTILGWMAALVWAVAR